MKQVPTEMNVQNPKNGGAANGFIRNSVVFCHQTMWTKPKEVGGIPIRPTRKNSQGIIQRTVVKIVMTSINNMKPSYNRYCFRFLLQISQLQDGFKRENPYFDGRKNLLLRGKPLQAHSPSGMTGLGFTAPPCAGVAVVAGCGVVVAGCGVVVAGCGVVVAGVGVVVAGVGAAVG